MDFRESLEFLYGLQRFGIKLGLDNTRTLLERAGRPQQRVPCIHVAGTNGKGSVCAFLAEILRQAGLKVGLYTSPHLQSFTERVRIDGEPLAEDEVAALTERLRPLAAGIPVTFFEFTTVLALCAFADHRVEIAILETGMGGRLDATNAVDPLLSIITPISVDHQEHLGATIAAIAAEKAGIIKPGIPVIIGSQPPAALGVLLGAAERCGAPVLLAGRDFEVRSDPSDKSDKSDGSESFAFCPAGAPPLPALRSPLPGGHQPHNAALALAAALELRGQGYRIDETAIRRGLEQTRWPGRLEWWGTGRRLLLDGAHNADGAKVLAAYLASLDCTGIHWLVGVKDDKNYRAILAALLPRTVALYAVAPPGVSATDPAELVALAAESGRPGRAFPTVAAGLEAARSSCGSDEIVLVAGSLFLVGAVRDLLMSRKESP